MNREYRTVNMAMSGGGVRGIAYCGVYEVYEKKGYRYANLAGVSAGAVAGALMGAKYTSAEIAKLLKDFNLKSIAPEEMNRRVPVIPIYAEFLQKNTEQRMEAVAAARRFLEQYEYPYASTRAVRQFVGYRSDLLKNIILFCKEGCLYDGDYIEEWVAKALAGRGIKTFGDLRDGIADPVNPRGYKVRMTAVDANRGKIIVLPDDLEYYGLDPDKFEVARAVRMSTSVPFAFTPVELKFIDKGQPKVHYILDGGVFDNFPVWLLGKSHSVINMGYRLVDRSKSKVFSWSTPLEILKVLISGVHDIGVPKDIPKFDFTADIDTSKVEFLDLNLSSVDKEYLMRAGKNSAMYLLHSLEKKLAEGWIPE